MEIDQSINNLLNDEITVTIGKTKCRINIQVILVNLDMSLQIQWLRTMKLSTTGEHESNLVLSINGYWFKKTDIPMLTDTNVHTPQVIWKCMRHQCKIIV